MSRKFDTGKRVQDKAFVNAHKPMPSGSQRSLNQPEPTDLEVHGQQQEQRYQHRDSYTMVAPREKKRTSLQQQAEKELKNYEAYKEERRLKHVDFVGTVGGGDSGYHGNQAAATSRNSPAKMMNPALEQRRKRDNYRLEQKKKENDGLQIKKDLARQKTLQNESREVTRQQQLQKDHKLKNEAFLRQLERKNKKTQKQVPEQNNAPDDVEDEETDEALRNLREIFPNLGTSFLQELLRANDQSIEKVVELLNS